MTHLPGIRRRGPAIFLGLALAGFAAACSTASASNNTAPAPIRCEIALDAVPGGTVIGGRISTEQAISGTYAMQIRSRSSGGSASISQSGDFEIRAGRTETIAETTLSGSPAAHSVDLSIRVEGRSLTCANPSL